MNVITCHGDINIFYILYLVINFESLVSVLLPLTVSKRRRHSYPSSPQFIDNIFISRITH